MSLFIPIFYYRILDNIQAKEGSNVEIADIEAAYKEACLKEGWKACCNSTIGKILQKIFPATTSMRQRAKSTKTQNLVYQNICFQPISHEEVITFNSQAIQSRLPERHCVISTDNDKITLGVLSNVITIGNILVIQIVMTKEKYAYVIRGTEVDHLLLSLKPDFCMSQEHFKQVLHVANHLRICCGMLLDETEDIEHNNCIIENVKTDTELNSVNV